MWSGPGSTVDRVVHAGRLAGRQRQCPVPSVAAVRALSFAVGARYAVRPLEVPLDRALTSAPCSISNFTAAGFPLAAAHIKAVVPRNVSFAFTSAPCASSTLIASRLPVRAAIINGVSPLGRRSLTSAPAFSSFSINAGIAVNARQRQHTGTFAIDGLRVRCRCESAGPPFPGRRDIRPSAALSRHPLAAHSRLRAAAIACADAALSPFITASATSLRSAPKLTAGRINTRAYALIIRLRSCDFSTLEFLKPAGAVADTVLVNSEHVQNAQQKISGRNSLRGIRQVTPSFKSSGRAARQNVRHVVVLMLIRIAHVAAVENAGNGPATCRRHRVWISTCRGSKRTSERDSD